MARTRAEIDNADLLAHLKRRGIDARVSTFDAGQTITFQGVSITSEWGDPSLYALVARRFPGLFPEDESTVQHEGVYTS